MMHLHFNCYLEGKKATNELMAQKDYRKTIYRGMKIDDKTSDVADVANLCNRLHINTDFKKLATYV